MSGRAMISWQGIGPSEFHSSQIRFLLCRAQSISKRFRRWLNRCRRLEMQGADGVNKRQCPCCMSMGIDWNRESFVWLIQKAHQLLAATRLLQLADGFGFDLADALAGDLEDVADFFQRVAVAVAQAVAQLDDLAL